MFKLIRRQKEIYEEDEYRLAYQYMLNFDPKDGVDYQWVCRYAEMHYERLQKVADVIDDKAESIIKVFASGSALLSLGAIINLEKFGIFSGLFWVLGILLALGAVISAGWVRYP